MSENEGVVELDVVLEPRSTGSRSRGSAILLRNDFVESSRSILASILAADSKESDDVCTCNNCSRYESAGNGLERYWTIVLSGS